MFNSSTAEKVFNGFIAAAVGSYNNSVSISVKRSIFRKVNFTKLLSTCTTSVTELPYLIYLLIQLIYTPISSSNSNWQPVYLSKYNYLIVAITQIILSFDNTMANTLYVHEVQLLLLLLLLLYNK